jgi:hypothetical protein
LRSDATDFDFDKEELMQTLLQDLRYGVRMLFKNPGFTLIAVITLALGIGATTAIFSVINALILQLPQVRDAERVAALWRTPKDKRDQGYVSYLELQDWRARHQGFEAIAAYKPYGMIYLQQDQAESVPGGLRVTANFLSLLQVRVWRGRDFQFAEEQRGAPDVAIISYQFWQSRLSGNEAVLGQSLTLNGKPFTIIGVLPPDFAFPLVKDPTELITTIAGEGGNLDQRGAQVLNPLGRLKPGVAFAQAQAELAQLAAQSEQQYPQHNRNITAYLVPGFDPKNVLTGQVAMPGAAYKNHDERVRYVTQTLDRLRALPGVESAAFVAPMPFSGGNVFSDFKIEGRPQPEPGTEPTASNRSVTAQYFQAIKIPLRQGRYFTEQDQRTSAGVAIINEALVRAYFPNEEPLGKYLSRIGANQNDSDPERWEIVGVVGDVHHSTLTSAARPEIYLPYQQNSWGWGNFFVRARQDAAGLTHSFTDAIRAGDKTIPVRGVRLLTQAISDTVAQPRFYTLLFALFGATGLLLTLTGIYSVVAYTVAQSTQEIGIRMALGAQTHDVLKLIIGQGMWLTLLGIVLGLLAAATLTRLMESLLFGTTPTDPLTFGGIALLLAVVSLLACWIPARRATKVDPMIALRCD